MDTKELKFLIQSKLTRFKSYFKKYDPTSGVFELEENIHEIIPIFKNFDAVQKKIEEKVENTDFKAHFKAAERNI